MSAKRKEKSYQPERDVHRITLYNTVYPEHQHSSRKPRLYLHFDFACFYAQVEQLRKRLYGIPLIIGGWRKDSGTVKGIVATASYEARAHGIKTGMSALEAYQLCPYVCMLQVDYEAYSSISTQVHYIFKKYSHRVERYSMDEYFMDITFLLRQSDQQVYRFAKTIQDEIYDTTGLFGTIGVARSKTYSKLSSGLNKPRGITIIRTDEEEKAHIYPLPVSKVWGVGGRRFEHLESEGYKLIGDVAERGSVKTFQRLFGVNFGKMLFETIAGKDQARVLEENDDYTPKWGVSYGHTFSEGSCDVESVKGEFAIAIMQVCYRMRAYGIRANSFSGVIGYEKREQPSVGFRFVTQAYTNIDHYVLKACLGTVLPALAASAERGLEIRNIILGTHQIDKTNQMNLFFEDEAMQVSRFNAMDEIKNRFGYDLIKTANTMIRVEGNTHFLERNV